MNEEFVLAVPEKVEYKQFKAGFIEAKQVDHNSLLFLPLSDILQTQFQRCCILARILVLERIEF
jgi:hypothetical protein